MVKSMLLRLISSLPGPKYSGPQLQSYSQPLRRDLDLFYMPWLVLPVH